MTSGRIGNGTGTVSPSPRQVVPGPAIECRASAPLAISVVETPARAAAASDTGIEPLTRTTAAFATNPSVTSGTPASRMFRPQKASAARADTARPAG